MDNAAHGIGAHVHNGLGLDLAGSRDLRRDILLYNFAALHRDYVFLALIDGKTDNRAQQNYHSHDNDNFLYVHSITFQRTRTVCTHFVYASKAGKVPRSGRRTYSSYCNGVYLPVIITRSSFFTPHLIVAGKGLHSIIKSALAWTIY